MHSVDHAGPVSTRGHGACVCRYSLQFAVGSAGRPLCAAWLRCVTLPVCAVRPHHRWLRAWWPAMRRVARANGLRRASALTRLETEGATRGCPNGEAKSTHWRRGRSGRRCWCSLCCCCCCCWRAEIAVATAIACRQLARSDAPAAKIVVVFRLIRRPNIPLLEAACHHNTQWLPLNVEVRLRR